MKTRLTIAAGMVGYMMAGTALAAGQGIVLQEPTVFPNPGHVGYNPQPCNPVGGYGFCFPLDPTNLNMVWMSSDTKHKLTWYTEAGHYYGVFDLIRVDDNATPGCLTNCPLQNATVFFFNVECGAHRFYQSGVAVGTTKLDINGTTRIVSIGPGITSNEDKWSFDGTNPAQVRAKQVCAELMMQ